MNAYTDYPIEWLGDEAGKLAPIRPCKVVSYDGNKYCGVMVDGSYQEIKAGYLYSKKGRCGEVPCIDVSNI